MQSALIKIGVVAAIVLVMWGSMHAFLPTINPAEKRPEGHVPGPCWACHFVSQSAALQAP